MECRQVRNYLAMYLDSELGPETTFEISQHLESCTGCQKLADREARLEGEIKGILTAPRATDELMWNRAVSKALNRPRTKLFSRQIMAVAAMLIAAAGIGYLVQQLAGHHELDLAAATASEHKKFLGNELHSYEVAGDKAALESYFKLRLSPQFHLTGVVANESTLEGGNLCELHGAPTAHVVLSVHDEPVSVFWFERKELAEFPDVKSRIMSEGASVHCKVNDEQFFARLTDDALVCAVGAIGSTEIQSLVDGLLGIE